MEAPDPNHPKMFYEQVRQTLHTLPEQGLRFYQALPEAATVEEVMEIGRGLKLELTEIAELLGTLLLAGLIAKTQGKICKTTGPGYGEG